jgi:glycosyltransferase involved in cell wall biosynthesis
MRRADGIIAVSEAARQDAIRLLGIPPEKIVTIHSGIASEFFHVTAAAAAAAAARYRLARPFVLCLGTVEPRKNFGAVVKAFRALPAHLQDEYELVVAGPMGWADRETAALVRSVRYLGYVAERDIAALTGAATAFAYPSLYEGFGFPVAQAMAAGVAVVTSNVSALPEIAGDAALLVDPRSHEELRDALKRILLYPDLRARMAARGRERAQLFLWETCAEKSWEFFHHLSGR